MFNGILHAAPFRPIVRPVPIIPSLARNFTYSKPPVPNPINHSINPPANASRLHSAQYLRTQDSLAAPMTARWIWSMQERKVPDFDLSRILTPPPKAKQKIPQANLVKFFDTMTGLSRAESIKRIDAYVFDGNEGVCRFTEEQTYRIFTWLYKLKASDQIIELIQCSPHASFRNDPAVRIKYGEAYLTSQFFKPEKVMRLMDAVLEKNSSEAQAWYVKGLALAQKCHIAKDLDRQMQQGNIQNVTLGKYLQCYPSAGLSSEHYKQNLAASIEALEKAYALKQTPKIAIRLMYQLIEAGNLERAAEIAKPLWSFYRAQQAELRWNREFVGQIIVAGVLSLASPSDLWKWGKLLGTREELQQVVQTLEFIASAAPCLETFQALDLFKNEIKKLL